MAFIRTLFEINRQIILFGYGLVFFVLGLAIALQSRRYSRLELARSLAWLAAFGLAHGLYEWVGRNPIRRWPEPSRASPL